jgi:NADH-quinone oxidoreductase subunit G
MSQALVSLTIDGVEITVPAGTLIVDAAKQAGIDIPVFCYHPKLESAGVCRMCLVEIGRPKIDRSTRKIVRDKNGDPVIEFGPKLETSCTTPVGEGWVVLVNSERAVEERKQVVEFLLTSHPLDCPVCDKGGECPLQNLTMAHGPGKSRFLYEDKMHLAKHVPLGDLIFLDRERCIQCARCIRFQTEIADDPVIAFSERGRKLEIVTLSEPGFASYFSGNTTDICPVGALTTADFRFGARPWELNATASICPHCAVGCNTMLNTRREARSQGRDVIKRVMPRQNEAVNEIWLCDKGRFAHHFASSEERLARPVIKLKRRGRLTATSWENAVKFVVEGLQAARGAVLGIAGGRASNEDLYALRRLMDGLGGRAVLHDQMAGGEFVQQVGVGAGTNLADLGSGDCILVVASDLHEEAPIWWLRVKQAAERGAKLIVANARPTRLDKHATHIVRYDYGVAAHMILGMLHEINHKKELEQYASPETKNAAKVLSKADNVVVFYGSEGMDYAASHDLAQNCASLLAATDHVGRANNGLVAVWTHCNTQGAWDMGVHPEPGGLAAALKGRKAAYIVAADPAGDEPLLTSLLEKVDFLVVQGLFLTETALAADVVLPAQSFVERDGTYTNGMRRVQRFFPAITPNEGMRADWEILSAVAAAMGIDSARPSAAAVMQDIAAKKSDYSEINYPALSRNASQWPHVGGKDIYFGGTAYPNHHGLGVQLTPRVERQKQISLDWATPRKIAGKPRYLMVPITKLYDRGTTVVQSQVLASRLEILRLYVNPEDAKRLGMKDEGEVEIQWDGRKQRVRSVIDEHVPSGVVLVPRSLGVPLATAVDVKVRPIAL